MKKTIVFGSLISVFLILMIPNVSTIEYQKMNESNYLDYDEITLYKCNGLKYEYTYEKLDLKYIYNITENLSNIIFTEYNESIGEIAKGRAYGTKGEHRAAKILHKKMSELGLWTYKEQIENTEQHPRLTHELEVVDYYVKINNKTVDSYIAPVWFKTSENNNEVNYTYNYSNLKIIKPPLFPRLYILMQKLLGKLEPFVIIMKDKTFDLDGTIVNYFPSLNNFYVNYYLIRLRQKIGTILYFGLWNKYMEYCKGILFYDTNNNCHNMKILKYNNHIPFIYINGTNGKQILEDIDNTRIDFKLEQNLNTSIISYNVIGQLNDTNPYNATVIIDCLYDSWWCQGTADAAIGMAMVLGIAKYFKDNNITPKYNLKFIGFSGEEHGFCAGSNYYQDRHSDENIKYVIDLNQLGFWQQNDTLSLNVICNKLGFLGEIWPIVKKADYGSRVNSSDKAMPIWIRGGGPSNSGPFAQNRKDCKTVCFLKDGGWKLHHRDGLNHTEGDVIKYFDSEDVNVTGEIIINVVKYLCTE